MVWARVAALATVIALYGLPVAAQAVCGPYSAITAKLEQIHGETRKWAGLSAAQTMIELWADTRDGSWSILRVRPDRWACLVAVGILWHDYEPPPKGDPT